ncbi:MAG: polysaccharide deacetylase family protein [Anaerovoracaceae bacterium]
MKFIKGFFSIFFICCLCLSFSIKNVPATDLTGTNKEGDDLIKWVDFDVSYSAMEKAMDVDIESFNQDLHISWINILAYLGTIYGGDFSLYKSSDIDKLVAALNSGDSIETLTRGYKYFDYYYKAYESILGKFLGLDKEGNYGLICYSPVAAGYWYNHSNDFGSGRDYGFKRKHLGHDLFIDTGTPIVAVESGRIEALGWNQYGGWRIGIRSHDGLRYYYYAHLRKDSPYAKGLKEGANVYAGQLIGFSGQSGYSLKENTNNINVPHLHFGMQLIFDQSQKDCNSEIWIDVYGITRLLSNHRAAVDTTTGKLGTGTDTDTDAVKVPILMYHGLTDKPANQNEYFINANIFENDLKYMKENGYTTITMTDLINYVYGKNGVDSLPEKSVVITFDDGYCNNYNLGSPLLKKYKSQGVISVIGSACEEASVAEYRSEDYCNVTWEQLEEMQSSGLWEVQNHTYNLHELKNGRKGARKKPNESSIVYKNMLIKDISTLQKKLTETLGVTPNTFTWPFGAITEEAHQVLVDLGFKATLSCYSGINIVKKGDPECLYQMKRNLRSPNVPIEKLLTVD